MTMAMMAGALKRNIKTGMQYHSERVGEWDKTPGV